MRSQQRFLISMLLSSMVISGCQTSDLTTPPPESTSDAATNLGAMMSTGTRLDAAMALWTLTLDPATLATSLTLDATREGLQNDDVYGLDVRRFFGPDDLRINRVFRFFDQIQLRWEVHHPFAPPTNLEGPATAKNRADLGVAGHLVFLVDTPNASDHSYFSDVIANTEAIANADSYLRPAGMLPTSLTANTFPAQMLVSETEDSRLGVSNGGSVTGNYGADGWTRAELGPFNDGWTGYGVLHQGQSSQRWINLNSSVLELQGPITFQIGIIVRYNDPRNATNQDERIAHRLPPASPDPTVFAYRMPHGALDCPKMQQRFTGGPIIANVTTTALEFELDLVDWDARAIVTSETDLSLDPDVTKVAVGERGYPTADMHFPRIDPDTLPVFLDAGDSTGAEDDPLQYRVVLNNEISEGQQPGIAGGLVRFRDPEADLNPPLMVPLDRDTLQPLATNLPEPVYYGGVQVTIQPQPLSFVHQYGNANAFVQPVEVVVDPNTGRTFLAGMFSGTFNANPGGPSVTLTSSGNQDCYLIALTAAGAFEWAVSWGGLDLDLVTGLTLTAAGEPRIVGSFLGMVDFDPGPGVVEHSSTEFTGGYCLALDADGNFQWVAAIPGEGGQIRPWAIATAPEAVFVGGWFVGANDFDHTAEVDVKYSNGGQDAFAWALTPSGGYLWTATVGGKESDQGSAIATTTLGAPVLAGNFSGTADFDPGMQLEERTAIGVSDVFVLDCNATGAFVAVHHIGVPANNTLLADIALRPADNMLYVAGQFRETLDLDPKGGIETVTSTGSTDIFVTLWDANRNYQWGHGLGGPNMDDVRGLTVTQAGAARLTGQIQGPTTVDFDPGLGVAEWTTVGLTDVWFWGLSTDGDYEWATMIGGPISGIFSTSIAHAPDGSLRAIGNFNNAVDFDPDPDNVVLRVSSAQDAWLVRYSAVGAWE